MNRQSMMQITGLIRRFVGLYQTRGRDPEIEQAWLRVGISVLGFAWCVYLVVAGGEFTRGLTVAMSVAGGAAIIGSVMILMLRHSHDHAIALRYVGIVTDMAAISIGMAGADEGGVPMIGVYLWVTVGNGFRFGPRYLLAAYWLQLLGFGLQLLFVPFWIQHRAIGLGLMLALAIVPLYVLVLLSRLTAQRDAAEQLSNAKSRFVANVSHELRTPLTGVFAVYDLLRSRKLAPDEQELVGMLGKAVSTLKTSVDAVLQMSKLEAGAERANARPFNLWYFLQQLAALVRPQSAAKGLAWNLHVDPSVPAIVVGDPDHLSHVLGNLLNNAFKFTHAGGVSLRVAAVGGDIRFEVVDTGIGIPLEHQERLFERFVQVDNSATRRFGGTGLGTSIARDLAELMGGRIGVVSAQGQGSTFWVELPLPEPASGWTPAEPTLRREIVVVGRDDSGADELAATLVALGYMPRRVAPALHEPPRADPQRHLAIVLAMSANDAAAYAESSWREGAGTACPWLVWAPEFTPLQRASLVRLGAAGLLATDVAPQALRTTLGALESRLELPASGDAPALPAGGVVRPLTILLADDNRSNQLLLSRILEDAGHTVRTAERGDRAFDLIVAGGIDLAILDLNMPDMSGPDVVKLYRASSIGAEKLPIMILSADATAIARQESLDAGADEFLTKPVTAATLIATIERLVAGMAARDPVPAIRAVPRSMAPAAPVPAAAPNLVDPDRVQALRRIARGDQGFLEKYVGAAFSELETAISDLRVAVAGGDLRTARDALHIIEGTGASIGGLALVANCKSLRWYIEVPRDPDCAGALAELSTTYALTKSTVLASLAEPREGAQRLRAAR
jgi:two-component system sensor histidine kinase RpfC